MAAMAPFGSHATPGNSDVAATMRSFLDRDCSLADVLAERAATTPDAPAYLFVDRKADRAISYRQLHEGASAFAAELVERGLGGRHVANLLPTSAEWLFAFFGTLLAGGIAVPLSAPGSARAMQRLATVLRNGGVAATAVTSRDGERLQQLIDPEALSAFGVMIDPLLLPDQAAVAHTVGPGRYGADSAAVFQYTSGSTSDPKGVIITHRNFIANAALIARAIAATFDDKTVSWLPLFHDMGLMTGIVSPMLAGRPSVLMQPAAFLVRPLIWLQAIARHRGTIAAAPNFAFDLCVERVTPDQLAQLDLRHWRVAVCGAEPVRPETLERFAAHFHAAGFDWRACMPAYGLAEATLFVSGRRCGGPDRQPGTASDLAGNRPRPRSRGRRCGGRHRCRGAWRTRPCRCRGHDCGTQRGAANNQWQGAAGGNPHGRRGRCIAMPASLDRERVPVGPALSGEGDRRHHAASATARSMSRGRVSWPSIRLENGCS